LVFAGVIGGLVAMGVIGLFIGPVILAVASTLLKTWMKTEGPSESGPEAHAAGELTGPI
jgi:predicted PurR-regulated permease PerM